MQRDQQARLIDTEDERLTAPERQFLRQLVLRLHNGVPAQPVRDRLIAGERGQHSELEEAIRGAICWPKIAVFSPFLS